MPTRYGHEERKKMNQCHVPGTTDDVIVYHMHVACYRIVHDRILVLYLPGSRNGRIPRSEHTSYPPDIRVQDTDNEEKLILSCACMCACMMAVDR